MEDPWICRRASVSDKKAAWGELCKQRHYKLTSNGPVKEAWIELETLDAALKFS